MVILRFTGIYKKANGAIQDFIKKKQYEEQSYEVEMYLYPTELPVKKGDIIAFTGNTGGMELPHLHFEFRNTKSEEILNRCISDLKKSLKTKEKPIFKVFVAYPLDSTTVNTAITHQYFFGQNKPMALI